MSENHPEVESFIDAHISEPESVWLDDIEDWVSDWHVCDRIPTMPLHEFLGMTRDEYDRWVRDPDEIHAIVEAHRASLSDC